MGKDAQPEDVSAAGEVVCELTALFETSGGDNVTDQATQIVEAYAASRFAAAEKVIDELVGALEGARGDMRRRAETGMNCTAEIEDGTLVEPWGTKQTYNLDAALQSAKSYKCLPAPVLRTPTPPTQ